MHIDGPAIFIVKRPHPYLWIVRRPDIGLGYFIAMCSTHIEDGSLRGVEQEVFDEWKPPTDAQCEVCTWENQAR